MDGTAGRSGYPPSPWQLRGQLYGSVFLVPSAGLTTDLPAGWRPARVAGRAVVAAVWVDYEPGGVLAYRELMTTVLVRRGGRLLPTITHIWVDSAQSRDGGRALWAIPKQLAGFTFAGSRFTARDQRGPVARGAVRAGKAAPARVPIRFRIVQSRGGEALMTPVRATARAALARGRFEADPSGPLAFLCGRRPLVSFVLRDFRMTFGRRERG